MTCRLSPRPSSALVGYIEMGCARSPLQSLIRANPVATPKSLSAYYFCHSYLAPNCLTGQHTPPQGSPPQPLLPRMYEFLWRASWRSSEISLILRIPFRNDRNLLKQWVNTTYCFRDIFPRLDFQSISVMKLEPELETTGVREYYLGLHPSEHPCRSTCPSCRYVGQSNNSELNRNDRNCLTRSRTLAQSSW